MTNKAYSYLIKSDNPKINGTRKRAIARSDKDATRIITARIRELFPQGELYFSRPIVMDVERVRVKSNSFATTNERHEGYVVVKQKIMIDIIYLHYETAVRYSAGGIVVPYKIAKEMYGCRRARAVVGMENDK